MEKQSTEFVWGDEDFDGLMTINDNDDAVQISLRVIPSKDAKILEAGCGTGRVVKHFHDLGYENTHGIELNEPAVKKINALYPDLKIIAGDLLNMPYEKDSFDVVVAYGLVEHFPDLGLNPPLKAIYDVLKPGGIGVISVPSMNKIRRTQHAFDKAMDIIDPRRNPVTRRALKREPLPERNKTSFPYYVHPQRGPFFEYRLTPDEFIDACKEAGYDIEESLPIYHMDGLFHIFGPRVVTYDHLQFHPTPVGKTLNSTLKKIPFTHNHMHMCVLRKPLS